MYNVVLLLEDELSPDGAQRVAALNQLKTEPVMYHLLEPADDATNGTPTTPATTGAHTSGQSGPRPVAVEDDSRDPHDRGDAGERLQRSVQRLADLGQRAAGSISKEPAIDALVDLVGATESQEVMILTGRHIVARVLHRDWPSQARQRLDIPVLHLVET
jgi:hypothetical protein